MNMKLGPALKISDLVARLTLPSSRPTKEAVSPLKSTGPAQWTIREVIKYITNTDTTKTLGVHSALFEDHVSNNSI